MHPNLVENAKWRAVACCDSPAAAHLLIAAIHSHSDFSWHNQCVRDAEGGLHLVWPLGHGAATTTDAPTSKGPQSQFPIPQTPLYRRLSFAVWLPAIVQRNEAFCRPRGVACRRPQRQLWVAAEWNCRVCMCSDGGYDVRGTIRVRVVSMCWARRGEE